MCLEIFVETYPIIVEKVHPRDRETEQPHAKSLQISKKKEKKQEIYSKENLDR